MKTPGDWRRVVHQVLARYPKPDGTGGYVAKRFPLPCTDEIPSVDVFVPMVHHQMVIPQPMCDHGDDLGPDPLWARGADHLAPPKW